MTTGMYEGAGHGPLWWVAYLGVAIVLVTVMILVMLRGIGRAGEATRATAQPAEGAADRSPLGASDVAQPAHASRQESHLTLHGAA